MIISKAFRIHQEKDYDISIPLFLIQADGICLDVFGNEFFRVRKRALVARKSIDERNVDWIWDAMAEPFRVLLPITSPCRDSDAWNRHVILHGRSLSYGTELNSLKAISLLSFLLGLDTDAREKAQGRREHQ